MSHPKFGERCMGIYASEDNPQKMGLFVRVIKRTGKLNPGTFYELTDGKGHFWQYPAENVRFGDEALGGPSNQVSEAVEEDAPDFEELFALRNLNDLLSQLPEGWSLLRCDDGEYVVRDKTLYGYSHYPTPEEALKAAIRQSGAEAVE